MVFSCCLFEVDALGWVIIGLFLLALLLILLIFFLQLFLLQNEFLKPEFSLPLSFCPFPHKSDKIVKEADCLAAVLERSDKLLCYLKKHLHGLD